MRTVPATTDTTDTTPATATFATAPFRAAARLLEALRPRPQRREAAHPQTTDWLQLPSITQPLPYRLAFWSSVLPALVATLMPGHMQRLMTWRARPYTTVFEADPALIQRWAELFNAPASSGLLTSQSVGTLLYMRILSDLGISLRHLLHLRHVVRYPDGPPALAAAPRQWLHAQLARTANLGRGRALAVLRVQITDSTGRLLAVVEDEFTLRQVDAVDLLLLPDGHAGDATQGPATTRIRLRPKIDPGAADAWCRNLRIAPDMAARYAAVSGDMNPVHTSMLGARLFGFKRPFLQGLALRNLVLAALTHSPRPLDSTREFDINFASPAWLGSTLRLQVRHGRFEVVGEDGRLVAYGHC